MAVPLTIAGVIYNYPVNEDESYGVNATNWAIAVTDVLNITYIQGDLHGATTLGNNSSGSISGLVFDSTVVRSVNIMYSIYRTTDAPIELAQCGTIRAVYKTIANTWTFDDDYTGDNAGIVFDIVGGQVVYSSSNVAGANHSCIIDYRALVNPI